MVFPPVVRVEFVTVNFARNTSLKFFLTSTVPTLWITCYLFRIMFKRLLDEFSLSSTVFSETHAVCNTSTHNAIDNI